MASSANFNSQTLAVYISGADVDRLLHNGGGSMGLFVGLDKKLVGQVSIMLDPETCKVVYEYLLAERMAVLDGKAKLKQIKACKKRARRISSGN